MGLEASLLPSAGVTPTERHRLPVCERPASNPKVAHVFWWTVASGSRLATQGTSQVVTEFLSSHVWGRGLSDLGSGLKSCLLEDWGPRVLPSPSPRGLPIGERGGRREWPERAGALDKHKTALFLVKPGAHFSRTFPLRQFRMCYLETISSNFKTLLT